MKIGKLAGILTPAFLVLIVLYLSTRNYTPGTYLIGWDPLHPEFNFPEAFRRVWEGVWRGEQGIGTIAAHAHMADLPRIIFLWLESFVLPASFLRYSYIFLCLALGPVGMYFFLKYVFQKQRESFWIYPAAMLGALFYLLNLGTLQNFYVPFEMFPTAFAFSPWLIYTGLKYLREGRKKNLILFALIVVLSSPMAYASTLWYTTFAGLFIFFALYSRSKRFLVLAITSILLNLYWILPNIYSLIFQSNVISNAQINLLFSSEAFFRNRDYGIFKDIILQKNFLFAWRNFNFANNQFTNLLGVWIKYLSNPAVLVTGYILAGFSILGLALAVIKREKTGLALIGTLVFTLFFLININPPTGSLYAYLYNNYGVFSEAFRMPFTKFSILFEVITSFYFGYLFFVVLTKRGKFLSIIKPVFFVAVVTGLIYFMLPAFNGWLIGPNVRKQLPVEYNQVSNWFNSNQEGRIALMPINSKYGWEYRNWGYEGSGFLTYGISDPILYRDFDRWSSANEDFYNQASFALYSSDGKALIDTLRKYQVRYLLLDESIINPGGTPDLLRIPEVKNILEENGIKQVAKFGFLTVYETGFGTDVSAPSKFAQTNSDFSYSPIDPMYVNGDYINTNNAVPVRETSSLPSGDPVVSEDLSINRGFKAAYNCDLMKVGKVFKTNLPQGILYRAEDGGASCDYLNYPDLKYDQAYKLRIAGENREGRSIKIYLFNQDLQTPELEEILPTGKFDQSFFIYPKGIEGSGYILNIETRSFGRIASENLLTKVEFYPTDYNYPSTSFPISNSLIINNIQKYGTWGYKVDVEGSGLMLLGQGYDQGWIAFSGNTKLEHTKVNSWANGWMIPGGAKTIYIVFWPQALEWGGMILGVLTFGYLMIDRREK